MWKITFTNFLKMITLPCTDYTTLHRLHVPCSLGLILRKIRFIIQVWTRKDNTGSILDRFIMCLQITGLPQILNLILCALNVAKFGQICNFAKNNNMIIWSFRTEIGGHENGRDYQINLFQPFIIIPWESKLSLHG